MTNNEAEYEALLEGLRLSRHLNITHLEVFSDAQLVVKQILGEFKTTNERMAKYAQAASNILKHFDSWSLTNVDRSVNQFADALSKLASSSLPCHSEPIYIKELMNPFAEKETVMNISDIQD